MDAEADAVVVPSLVPTKGDVATFKLEVIERDSKLVAEIVAVLEAVYHATVPVTLATVVAVIKARAGTIIFDFLNLFFILVFFSFLFF